MEIQVLGTWSAALQPGKFNTSFLINKKILLDCGPYTPLALINNGIDPAKLDTVLITHMHLDHYGGLPQLIWQRGLNEPEKELNIVGPAGIENSIKKILDLYYTPEYMLRKTVFLENYDGIKMSPGNHSIPDIAYRLEIDNKSIFYSGDTSFSYDIINAGKNSDVFIHEATFPGKMENEAKKYGHSTFPEAYKAFIESKSKLFIPTHMSLQSMNEARAIESKDMIVPYENMIFMV